MANEDIVQQVSEEVAEHLSETVTQSIHNVTHMRFDTPLVVNLNVTVTMLPPPPPKVTRIKLVPGIPVHN